MKHSKVFLCLPEIRHLLDGRLLGIFMFHSVKISSVYLLFNTSGLQSKLFSFQCKWTMNNVMLKGKLHRLRPYRQWLYLTHKEHHPDTIFYFHLFIHCIEQKPASKLGQTTKIKPHSLPNNQSTHASLP